MALSMDEQRMLAEIERHLAAEEPGLASNLARLRKPGRAGIFRSTRARVSGATSGRPLTTLDTVGSDTPASAATAASVARRRGVRSPGLTASSVLVTATTSPAAARTRTPPGPTIETLRGHIVAHNRLLAADVRMCPTFGGAMTPKPCRSVFGFQPGMRTASCCYHVWMASRLRAGP